MMTPNDREFFPRRIYGRGIFCVVNDTAALAWRNWEPEHGITGLVSRLRHYHQPAGDGSDMQMAEIAFDVIGYAVHGGYLRAGPHGAWEKLDTPFGEPFEARKTAVDENLET